MQTGWNVVIQTELDQDLGLIAFAGLGLLSHLLHEYFGVLLSRFQMYVTSLVCILSFLI